MRHRGLTTGLAAVLLAGVAAPPSTAGTADQIHERSTAPHMTMGDTFTYKGREIEPHAAAVRGLACNQAPDGTTCFDTQNEALAAEGLPPERAQAKVGRKRGPRARAALVCSPNDGRPLVLWQHGDEEGWNVNLFTRQWWADLDSYDHDNEASSYRMGGHSGHISDGIYGTSYWYPGPTGICDRGLHMGAYNWTDRATSRYRN